MSLPAPLTTSWFPDTDFTVPEADIAFAAFWAWSAAG